jgi:hypothetical protein
VKTLQTRAFKIGAGVVSGFAGALAFAGSAFATGIEYSDIVSPAKTEFEAALTAVLPFVGLVIGVLVGIAVVKRLAKAR